MIYKWLFVCLLPWIIFRWNEIFTQIKNMRNGWMGEKEENKRMKSGNESKKKWKHNKNARGIIILMMNIYLCASLLSVLFTFSCLSLSLSLFIRYNEKFYAATSSFLWKILLFNYIFKIFHRKIIAREIRRRQRQWGERKKTLK